MGIVSAVFCFFGESEKIRALSLYRHRILYLVLQYLAYRFEFLE